MKHIEEFEKNSKKMLKKIKKDLSQLIEHDLKEKNSLEVAHKDMHSIHKQLYELESSFITTEISSYNKEKERELKVIKKILIRKTTKKSRSFASWFFNNNDI